jgi:hypothetical protein
MSITYRIKEVDGDTSFQHVTLKVLDIEEGDYFDMSGNYLGSTKNSKKKIFITGRDTAGVPYSHGTLPKEFYDKNVSFAGIGNIVNIEAAKKYGTIITDLPVEVRLKVAKKIYNHYYREAGYSLNELKYRNITDRPDDVNAFALTRFGGATLHSSDLKYGEKDISIIYGNLGTDLITGWDIINLFAHERGQHMEDLMKYKENINKIFPGDYEIERRAYMHQVKHESWAKISPKFKDYMVHVIGKYVHRIEYEPYFKK